MAAAGFSMQAMLPTASSSRVAQPIGALRAPINSSSNGRVAFSNSMTGQKLKALQHSVRAERAATLLVSAVKDGAVLDRKLRVAVIGGGPSGACTAETLAKGGIETFLIERKLDNCKVGDLISAQVSSFAGVCSVMSLTCSCSTQCLVHVCVRVGYLHVAARRRMKGLSVYLYGLM